MIDKLKSYTTRSISKAKKQLKTYWDNKLFDKQISFILSKEGLTASSIDILFKHKEGDRTLFRKSYVWNCPTTGIKPDIEVQFAIYPENVGTMQVTLILKNFHIDIDMHEYTHCYIEAGYGSNGNLARMGGEITNLMLERPNPNGSFVIQLVDGSKGLTESILRAKFNTIRESAMSSILAGGSIVANDLKEVAKTWVSKVQNPKLPGSTSAALKQMKYGINVAISEPEFISFAKQYKITGYKRLSTRETLRNVMGLNTDGEVTVKSTTDKYQHYFINPLGLMQLLVTTANFYSNEEFTYKVICPDVWTTKTWSCVVLNGHYDSLLQLVTEVQTLLDTAWEETTQATGNKGAVNKSIFPKLTIKLEDKTFIISPAGSWIKSQTSSLLSESTFTSSVPSGKTVSTSQEEIIAITKVNSAALSGEGVMVTAPWDPRIRPYCPVLLPLKYFSSIVRNDFIGDYIAYNKNVGIYYPYKIEVKFSTLYTNVMRIMATRNLSN